MSARPVKLELSHTYPVSVDKVFAALRDTTVFQTIHPLIYRVDRLENDRFRFHEATKIYIIPFYFGYDVDVQIETEPRCIKLVSEVRKGIWILLTFTFEGEGEVCRLHEAIQLQGPAFITKWLAAKLTEAHQQMFLNLEQLLTTGHVS